MQAMWPLAALAEAPKATSLGTPPLLSVHIGMPQPNSVLRSRSDSSVIPIPISKNCEHKQATCKAVGGPVGHGRTLPLQMQLSKREGPWPLSTDRPTAMQVRQPSSGPPRRRAPTAGDALNLRWAGFGTPFQVREECDFEPSKSHGLANVNIAPFCNVHIYVK